MPRPSSTRPGVRRAPQAGMFKAALKKAEQAKKAALKKAIEAEKRAKQAEKKLKEAKKKAEEKKETETRKKTYAKMVAEEEALAEARKQGMIRQQIKENIRKREEIKQNIKATQQAVERWAVVDLWYNSDAFRKEYKLPKKKHYMDPFQGLKWVSNLSPAERTKIKMAADRLDIDFRKGIISQKFAGELKRIEKEYPGMRDKLNNPSILRKMGGEVEKFCNVIGLERFLGLKINPAEIVKSPLREYQEDIAKRDYIPKANSHMIMKRFKGRLAELEREAAYFTEEQERMKGKKAA